MRGTPKQINLKRFGRALVCAAGVLLLSYLASAEILPVKTYTTADGLGSSFVSYLMRDSRGFLWFATRDGLSRFDGQRFTTYRVGTRDAPPGIEQIIETRSGVYWIVTTGGIYRYDPKTASSVPNQTDDRPVLNAEFIDARRGVFYEDRTGKLWLNDNHLNIVEEKDGQISFNKVELNLPENPSIPINTHDFRQASDGSFWIATSWGLVRRLPTGRDIFYRIESPRTDYLSSILEDSAGRIWIGRSSGIYVFKPEPAEELSKPGALTVHALDARALPQPGKQPVLPEKAGEIYKFSAIEGLDKSLSNLLYKSADNHVWISTASGIIEFDGRFFRYFNAAQGVTSGSGQIIDDLDGNLWIGGFQGLERLDRSGLSRFDAADGLRSPNITVIDEFADGKLYVGDPNYLISRFDGERFETVRPPLPPDAQPMWTSNPIFLDSRNQWWFLTSDKLFRFAAPVDFAALAGQKPLAEYDRRNGLKGNQMYRIYEDRRKDIWISVRAPASTGELGLSKWNRKDETFYSFSETENFPAGKSPSAFAEDANGDLWIGLYEGGLLHFRDGRFTEVVGDDAPKGVITGLHLDVKGRLWVTTASNGVGCLENLSAEAPRFVYYRTENGLASNNVRSVAEDNFGQIYVGTARGVDRITPGSGQIKHYTTNDGLAGDFVSTVFRASDGALWFGTPTGLSRLIPKPEIKTAAPPVWLSGLRVAGESRMVSELGSAAISNLALAPAQNNLQIDFFGIDFKASESLRYQYLLEGADKDWSAPTDQRTVNYANLSSGNYRFLVRAVNAYGLTSENPASISFTIARPVWQRWWFLLLLAMTVGGLIYLVYSYRLKRLVELEKVRTRIATDLHDDIGASLSKIAILSEVVHQRVAPVAPDDAEINEPLEEIAGTSRELVDSMSDIVWAINPERDHLSDLIQRMRSLAGELTEFAEIGFRVKLSGIEEDSDLPLGADLRREIYLIFKETINNLVKHAGCDWAQIEFRLEADEFMFIVKDDGQGFAVPANGAHESNGTRGGNGLPNMKRRAANMNGSYQIASEPGKGTTVVLRVPLQKGFRGFSLRTFYRKN
jgi:signal transduction histidine kinase/ligand-binding sensor domain-containing protein